MTNLPLVREFMAEDEAALHAEAQRLAPLLKRGDCLRLEGTLGAGKTSFTRALVQALSAQPVEVSSPTFTLLQSYDITLHGTPAELWHADLYRIDSPHALEELGIHELPARGVLCVEWPGIAEGWLPPEALHLHLTVGNSPTSRVLRYHAAPNSGWDVRLAEGI